MAIAVPGVTGGIVPGQDPSGRCTAIAQHAVLDLLGQDGPWRVDVLRSWLQASDREERVAVLGHMVRGLVSWLDLLTNDSPLTRDRMIAELPLAEPALLLVDLVALPPESKTPELERWLKTRPAEHHDHDLAEVVLLAVDALIGVSEHSADRQSPVIEALARSAEDFLPLPEDIQPPARER